MSSPKQYFVKTFGCQMNVADSERMESLLAEGGMVPARVAEEADVLIINGCSVRDKAVHKAVSFLGTTQALKKKPIIGVGGCVGSLEKDDLFRRAPYLDFVFGPDTIDQLPELVHRVAQGERHILQAQFDKTLSYSTQTKVNGRKAQAFVNIMKGCDKFCTYCIVPFTRGREKSRTIDEILDDLSALVSKGVREVTLLGQNVNSFGKGNPNTRGRTPTELHSPIGKVGPRAGDENFPMLLRAIDSDPRLKSLKWIKYTSSHPLDFSDELIECYAPAEKGGVSKLAPYLHLPVQSGSDRVLSKMGRHHAIQNYIKQMDRLREICPDVGLSTDLIVGFPTETEEEFQETLRLLDRVRYDNIFAFAYSPRPGTRAAKLPDDVPAEEKMRRLNHLLTYQLKISEQQHVARVGKVLEVLVEGEAKNEGAKKQLSEADRSLYRVWTGHSACGRVVNFLSDSPRPLTGRFVQVKIESATALSLSGSVVHDPWAAEQAQDYLTPATSEVVS